MNGVFLSIVTPTYNRQSELEFCYKSLIEQKNQNFEWIIVDDGSTDNTESLVKSWIGKTPFMIKYYKQGNKGRYVALNKGVQNATGQLCMFMDSDDWFIENSIENIFSYWKYLSSDIKESICGVSTLCYDEEKELIGDKFPKECISDFFTIRIADNIKGDKKEIIKTDILKEYPFPVFKDQKRVPTSYVLFSIAKKYNAAFVNLPMIYKQYCDDGWSKNINKVRKTNSLSSHEYYKHIINLHYPFRYRKAIGFYSNYFRYTFHLKKSLVQSVKEIKYSNLVVICIVLGWFLFYKDNFKK